MEPIKPTFKYTEVLQEIGLSNEESLIYQALLEKSPLPARKISLKTGIGRSMVYKTIDSLIERKLVEKTEIEGKVAVFEIKHPQELKKQLKERKEEINRAKVSLDGVFGNLVSSFNLLEGKPNIQFFEGEKGMKEVLDDSLYAKEDLMGIVDLEAIQKYIPEVNAQYKKDREKYGIRRKGLVLKTDVNIDILRKYSDDITDTKLLKCNSDQCEHLNTIMNIYDGKVSYITLTPDSMIGVIIEDPHIYHLHKFLFGMLWEQGEKIG